MIQKISLLSLFALIIFIPSIKSQNTIDVAEGKTIHRLTVTPTNNGYFNINLKPIIKSEFTKIDTASEYIVGLQEDKYKIIIAKLVNEEWNAEIQDSTVDGFLEYNDKIENIKTNLISSLSSTFSDIKIKYELSKLDALTDIGYGLSENEIQNHKNYLKELGSVQNYLNTIRASEKLIKRKIKTHSSTTNPDNNSVTSKQITPKNDIQNNNEYLKLKNSSLKLINYITKDANVESAPIDVQNNHIKQSLNLDSNILNSTIDSLLIYKRIYRKTLYQIDKQRPYMVHLIGDARVISSFKNSKASDINAGFGLLAVKPGYSEFIGIVTVAQAYEDSTRDFGQSILVPGVQRFSLLSRFRSYSIFKYSSSGFIKSFGLGLDVNITPFKWTKDNTTESIKVIPIAINILAPYTWVHQSKPGQDYAISTDIGLSLRSIAGSATNDQIRDYLGINKLPKLRTYIGPIFGLNVKYNALRVQFHAPLLITENENRVQGLTNGQVYASIGIIANLTGDISKYLKKSED